MNPLKAGKAYDSVQVKALTDKYGNDCGIEMKFIGADEKETLANALRFAADEIEKG
ncbi:MAG: hypothetical protein K5981_09380 [Clostridia bacterium]|nr:hypothetical protein [Clostridia bacterium]